MPKLSGLFDSFDNLDQISIENIALWVKPTPNLIQLENYVANKILYPQSLPLSELDMQVDLAILREALKMSLPKSEGQLNEALLGSTPFLNTTLRKIIIPEKFLTYIPNLVSLTWVFIDALLLERRKEDWFEDLWTVVVSSNSEEVVGSVLLPQFGGTDDTLDINVVGKNYKIRPTSLTVIPCLKERCQISYKLNKGKILGKNEAALEVYGGRLGVMIDGRSI